MSWRVRALILSIAVLMFSAAAWTALIPIGSTVYYIDGKPYLGFIFPGDMTIVPTITVQPDNFDSVILPDGGFLPVDLSGVDLEWVRIGLLNPVFPGSSAIIPFDPGMLDGEQFVLGLVIPDIVPEPASILLFAGGYLMLRKKDTMGPV